MADSRSRQPSRLLSASPPTDTESSILQHLHSYPLILFILLEVGPFSCLICSRSDLFSFAFLLPFYPSLLPDGQLRRWQSQTADLQGRSRSRPKIRTILAL